MLLHIYLNIKTFFNAFFVIYHITIIIIKFCLLSTIKIYTIFQNLYIMINLYILKECYAITTKQSKKDKKREL